MLPTSTIPFPVGIDLFLKGVARQSNKRRDTLMKIDVRPRKRNAPRPAWKVAVAYGQWLRGRPCAFAGADCEGPIEMMHTPDPMSKGMGTKAADCNAIPGCVAHHHRQTARGWSAVRLTRETAQAMGDAYWRAWPGRIEWERTIGN